VARISILKLATVTKRRQFEHRIVTRAMPPVNCGLKGHYARDCCDKRVGSKLQSMFIGNLQFEHDELEEVANVLPGLEGTFAWMGHEFGCYCCERNKESEMQSEEMHKEKQEDMSQQTNVSSLYDVLMEITMCNSIEDVIMP
jgi:hypothetical protein